MWHGRELLGGAYWPTKDPAESPGAGTYPGGWLCQGKSAGEFWGRVSSACTVDSVSNGSN